MGSKNPHEAKMAASRLCISRTSRATAIEMNGNAND